MKNTKKGTKTTNLDQRVVIVESEGFEGFIRRVRKSPPLAGVAKPGQRRENSAAATTAEKREAQDLVP